MNQLILTKDVHHLHELYLNSIKVVIITAFGRNETIHMVCKDIAANSCNALGLDPRQQSFICAIVRRHSYD